jgi:hypothetical protein
MSSKSVSAATGPGRVAAHRIAMDYCSALGQAASAELEMTAANRHSKSALARRAAALSSEAHARIAAPLLSRAA